MGERPECTNSGDRNGRKRVLTRSVWPSIHKFKKIGVINTLNRYPNIDTLAALSKVDEWMNLSNRALKRIELRTRLQSDCELWFEYRKHLITASSVTKIYNHIINGRSERASIIIEKFRGGRNIDRIPAVLYGKTTEKIARKAFEDMTGTRVLQRGLVLDEEFHYIACSPDGIVQTREGFALLEIKCPFRAKNNSIDEIKLEYLTNGELNKNHSYYGQCQFGMRCTGTSKCYFYIYSQYGSKCITIERDDVYINNILEVLCNFYTSYYLKKL